MSTEVKVNFSVLENAIQVYNTQIEALNSAYSQAVSTMERLRSSAWRTAGSDEFFRNYDESWKVDFKDHIEYLEHLRDCLTLAREGFYEEYCKKTFITEV